MNRKLSDEANEINISGDRHCLSPDDAENQYKSTAGKITPIRKGWLLLIAGFCVGLASQFGLKIVNSVFSQQSEDRLIASQSSERILFVKTKSVNPVESYQESRSYTGKLVARRSSELGFERSGQLVQILVDEGDRVQAGTPLAYLDTQNLRAKQQELLAQRAQAVAQRQEMEAGVRPEKIAAAQALVRDINEQLKLAQIKSERREALYTEGAIAREQLEQAKFDANALQARLDQAKSQLEELRSGTRREQVEAQKAVVQEIDANLANLNIELEKSVLKAPFSGTIAERRANEGHVVSAGETLLRLVEDEVIEVHIGVPLTNGEQIQTGSSQQVAIAQKVYPAKVTSILPEVDSRTHTVTVVLRLPRSAAREVLPGQVAKLKLTETIQTSGYWLPTTALIREVRGLWSCYALGQSVQSTSVAADSAFRVERRDVEVLYTDGERVLVRGTLHPGDQVIINGTHRFVSGQLVHPLNSEKI